MLLIEYRMVSNEMKWKKIEKNYTRKKSRDYLQCFMLVACDSTNCHCSSNYIKIEYDFRNIDKTPLKQQCCLFDAFNCFNWLYAFSLYFYFPVCCLFRSVVSFTSASLFLFVFYLYAAVYSFSFISFSFLFCSFFRFPFFFCPFTFFPSPPFQSSPFLHFHSSPFLPIPLFYIATKSLPSIRLFYFTGLPPLLSFSLHSTNPQFAYSRAHCASRSCSLSPYLSISTSLTLFILRTKKCLLWWDIIMKRQKSSTMSYHVGQCVRYLKSNCLLW